jgi:hypothetical protein
MNKSTLIDTGKHRNPWVFTANKHQRKQVTYINKHKEVMQIRCFLRLVKIKKGAIFRVGYTNVLKRFNLRTARGESDLNDTGEIRSTRSCVAHHSDRALKAPVFAADLKLG